MDSTEPDENKKPRRHWFKRWLLVFVGIGFFFAAYGVGVLLGLFWLIQHPLL